VPAEGFDVPGVLRIGPAARSVWFWPEELTRCRGRKRTPEAGLGAALDPGAARLQDSRASCAARRRLVDTCSEFCFWRDRCDAREKRCTVSARAVVLAIVAFFRRLRAAAAVSFALGVGEPGNERCGLSEVGAGEPVVGSG
jgi:hypothetical protein